MDFQSTALPTELSGLNNLTFRKLLDYNNKYTIDTFIRDFGELVSRGYNFDDIKGDFGAFLDKQKQLKKNAKRTNKYGVTEDEIDSAWRRFVKGV